MREGSRDAGHRRLAEHADFVLEAWAPSREGCIAEAVQALVECFADVTTAVPTRTLGFEFPAAPDDRLLAAVLEESLSVFEIFGVVPVDTLVERAEDGGLVGSFDAADVQGVTLVGSAPVGVSVRELEFGHGDGWRALVAVQV